MPDLQPLLLNDRPLICEYLRHHPPELSEFTYTNLFVWRHSRPIRFTTIANSLVFFIDTPKSNRKTVILFGPPLGDLSVSQIEDIFGDKLAGAIRIPEKEAIALKEAGFTVKKDRDNADYIYRVADLAELSGRNYAKKRNQIKHCLQKFRCEHVTITKTIIQECLAMQSKWCQARECVHDPGLCSENIAISDMFAHYEEFGLIGSAIRVDGIIQAYAVGEQLHPGTAVCHFEKALPGVPGLGQLINQWFAKYNLQQFEFVNREQDLGIPGLRQAKESYFPHHLLQKYQISFAESFSTEELHVGSCAEQDRLRG